MNVRRPDSDQLSELPRGAEYYPVGLSPYQLNPTDPYAKTTDMFALIKALRQRSDGKTYLLVANPYSNILANASEATPQEAQEKAHRLARADQILYEAIQDVLEEQGDTSERIPVQIMSEIIDDEKFSAMMYRLTTFVQSNMMFAEAVYACVPENFRPRAHRTKTLSQLSSLPGDHMRKMSQRIDYVLQQIAQVLMLKGRKLGHIKETSYNAVTVFAAELLNIPTVGLSFEQLDPEGATGTIPYRTIHQNIGQIRDGVISVETDLGMLKKSYIFRESERDTEYTAAQNHVATMDLLYQKMLARTDADLEPTIKFRYVREMILTLIHGPEPVYQCIFEESGVLDVLNGSMTLEEFEHHASLLPFHCTPKKQHEAPESYFIRFINALLHHDGPVVAGLRQTGIQYKMCEKIIKLVEGQENDQWNIRYRDFYLAMFMKFAAVYSAPIDDIATAKMNILKDFFNLIRDTDMENLYRKYLGMPENSNPHLPSGDRTTLKKLFTSDLWGDEARKYFTGNSY